MYTEDNNKNANEQLGGKSLMSITRQSFASQNGHYKLTYKC